MNCCVQICELPHSLLIICGKYVSRNGAGNKNKGLRNCFPAQLNRNDRQSFWMPHTSAMGVIRLHAAELQGAHTDER